MFKDSTPHLCLTSSRQRRCSRGHRKHRSSGGPARRLVDLAKSPTASNRAEVSRLSEVAVVLDFAPDLSDRLLLTSRTGKKMASADENREIAVSTISGD